MDDQETTKNNYELCFDRAIEQMDLARKAKEEKNVKAYYYHLGQYAYHANESVKIVLEMRGQYLAGN